MQFIFRNIIIYCALFFFSQNVFSQCTVLVDTANVKHINCPNGGATGNASLTQGTYTNYSYQHLQRSNLRKWTFYYFSF